MVQPGPAPQEQQIGIETGLTPQQKLALLEERLLHGEIDQDIYENLKAKFEMEAKPYEPVPQLPPAQNLLEDQPEVTEQPTVQQISDSKEEKVDGENNK